LGVRLVERSYYRIQQVVQVADRAIRLFHTAGWIGVQALGLGLLDPEELVRLTSRHYESSGHLDPAYNLEAGLWLWEQEALQRFFPPTGRIAVGAAGSGREMVALHRAGYSVEGFECGLPLAEAGQEILRKVGCPGRLIWAPPGTVPPLAGPFDGAIMGWSGYMYIPLRAQRVRLLQDFRRILRSGAPLLLSFKTRHQYERRMLWSARGANWIRKIRGVPTVAPGDRLGDGFQHWFNREDIASEIDEAGLQLKLYSTDRYGWAVGIRAEA
jgi:hypothetical protein